MLYELKDVRQQGWMQKRGIVPICKQPCHGRRWKTFWVWQIPGYQSWSKTTTFWESIHYHPNACIISSQWLSSLHYSVARKQQRPHWWHVLALWVEFIGYLVFYPRSLVHFHGLWRATATSFCALKLAIWIVELNEDAAMERDNNQGKPCLC